MKHTSGLGNVYDDRLHGGPKLGAVRCTQRGELDDIGLNLNKFTV